MSEDKARYATSTTVTKDEYISKLIAIADLAEQLMSFTKGLTDKCGIENQDFAFEVARMAAFMVLDLAQRIKDTVPVSRRDIYSGGAVMQAAFIAFASDFTEIALEDKKRNQSRRCKRRR